MSVEYFELYDQKLKWMIILQEIKLKINGFVSYHYLQKREASNFCFLLAF